MSSILKALEKVEQERNARHEGPLGRFQKEREQRRPWVVPACVVAGAAAAALITFAAMGGFSAKNTAPQGVAQAPVAPAPLAAPVPEPAPLPVEVISTPAVQEEGKPAPKPKVTSPSPASPAAQAAAEAPAAVQVALPTVVVKKSAVALPPHRAVQETAARKQQHPAAKVGLSATAHPSPAPAAAAVSAPQPAPSHEIRVTGIAWQKDAGNSVAMINGRQVYEGETVEGARVKEILQDKVRFVGSGGATFEVPLGAGQ
ncbi:hypothetical protein LPW11_03670 [Geomonas sp. RF6]|uniref:hypothetical protein n=1 Tax=Geomonas sp. RF6 TaxID=2897342 RepID=UPI001E2C521E|nr:hypothetical protein [Geomonas sp. RF6]UFS71296.1 hypothetical protein LPW11_03670 [Geomonas sp. RF6]